MKFIDRTEIHIKSGHGGAGLVSFRAAKNQPKLGPDGGNGARGGHVYLIGESGINSLSCFRYRHYYKAADGGKGGPNGRTGRTGKDLYLKVPLGTIAIDRESGRTLGEILVHGETLLVAEGGEAGFGNLHYLSSRHQAPDESTPGGEGKAMTLRFELKLMADVGFAGFPNAGKSTLLSCISAARPKVADYPFTTLTPQLGVVDVDDPHEFSGRSFVAADIPGLIEGAKDGRGLGHAFLRHLERTSVVAYVIEAYNYSEEDPIETYQKLRIELEGYSETLASRKAIVVLSKIDTVPEHVDVNKLVSRFAELNLKAHVISAVQGKGLAALKREIYDLVEAERQSIEQTPENFEVDLANEYRLVTKSTYFDEMRN